MKPIFLALFIVLSLSIAHAAKVKDYDANSIDENVDPCDDFYGYACGMWIQKTEIPPDRGAWSRGFYSLDEENLKKLKKIVGAYSSGSFSPANKYAKPIGDYYSSCMNEKKVETDSLKKIKEELKAIDGLDSAKGLPTLLGQLHLKGVPAFFSIGSDQDYKKPEEVIAYVDQGGITLPDRDYYIKDDSKLKSVLEMFRGHVSKMQILLGAKQPAADDLMKRIVSIETSLAKNSLAKEARRDPKNIYHRINLEGLKKAAPGFDWDIYFGALGYPQIKDINVTVPEFFTAFDQLLKKISLEDLKAYLKWHLVQSMVPALPKKFVEQNFAFTSAALTGQKQLKARWKRCLDMVGGPGGHLNFALGQSFVKLHYGEDGKAISKAEIKSIEAAFEKQLKTITWMDEATKKEASRKLHKIFNKIGYPDTPRNYDDLKVDRGSFFKNYVSGNIFETRYSLNKVGKPLDRSEWYMPPQMVNAYYNANLNEMVFPAGILQPPYFSKSASSAANFGAIGMVMGHELTHGFDDEGRSFDADGKMVDWWSPKVSAEYNKRAECIEKQYGNYRVQKDIPINGKLTLGENIADNGGIKLAYLAWKETHPTTAEDAKAKMSPDKVFFLSFAQSWCFKITEQEERSRIVRDPHAPPRYRVNGPLQNLPEFAQVYGCQAGSKMAPVNRCSVW